MAWEIFSSSMFSSSRFISSTARAPSRIILSSSGFPVEAGSGFGGSGISTSYSSSLHTARSSRYTPAESTAAKMKWVGRYRSNARA